MRLKLTVFYSCLAASSLAVKLEQTDLVPCECVCPIDETSLTQTALDAQAETDAEGVERITGHPKADMFIDEVKTTVNGCSKMIGDCVCKIVKMVKPPVVGFVRAVNESAKWKEGGSREMMCRGNKAIDLIKR